MLVKSGLVTSKSEARRAVQQGGAAADGEKFRYCRIFGKEELGRRNYFEKRKEKLPPGCCRVRSGEKRTDQIKEGKEVAVWD